MAPSDCPTAFCSLPPETGPCEYVGFCLPYFPEYVALLTIKFACRFLDVICIPKGENGQCGHFVHVYASPGVQM